MIYNINDDMKGRFIGKTITALEFSKESDGEDGDGRLALLPLRVHQVYFGDDGMLGLYNKNGDVIEVYQNEDVTYE